MGSARGVPTTITRTPLDPKYPDLVGTYLHRNDLVGITLDDPPRFAVVLRSYQDTGKVPWVLYPVGQLKGV